MQRKRRDGSKAQGGMPRHVLVGDDGSEGAARAVAMAITIAAAVGARMTAVYVRAPIESHEEARSKLAGTVEATATADVDCEVVVERPVGVTNPGRRIMATATRVGADLIIVGARGAGLVRRLMGSVSSYVVSRASVSVCVVR